MENADRFGLSQLHQLRGRVGRGQAKSYCVLLSDVQNDDTKRRLKALTQTSDGFRIAEEDLKLRGPGDFFGSRQHGLPTLKAADLSCDMPLLAEARDAAQQLLAGDPLADPAGARRAPPPGTGPVPAKGRLPELKQGTLSALEMPAISSGAGTMFRRRCSLLSPRRLPGGMGQIFPRK